MDNKILENREKEVTKVVQLMDHAQTIKTIYINPDVIQTNIPTSGLITKDMFENCYGVYVMDLGSNHCEK